MRTARSRGRAVADGPLVLRYLPNVSDPPRNRYGVVAGRKSGGSVQRNRLKRVTREALRELHPSLRPGYDLVIIIRGTVEELPGSAEARQLLTGMLRRAGSAMTRTIFCHRPGTISCPKIGSSAEALAVSMVHLLLPLCTSSVNIIRTFSW